ncbi:type II toxin-antitoxin system HigB family toxin [Spirosoma sp. KNUC1025]|uniref:type II toxin-antitoxin system HigB family toxin n=1 Tax=Spirosoma sp. KNUC1025 TaxID=2894082 RepID=UPI00386B7163|nr:type II toxin-antitoxin system HigB family toxin [Spirosoma sp. KNUC1025]
MFNIIARRTLLEYCNLYPKAANALKQWYAELQQQEFANFNELKAVYGSVSIVADDRVVFNIMGNQYRLVARIVFDYKTIQIKWFGTHAEYDKVDVTTVQYQQKS